MLASRWVGVWVLSGVAGLWSLPQSVAQEPAPGSQVEMTFQASSDQEVPYLLYLPEDYQTSGERRWPTILFLHGRGESNGPLSVVAKWGPPRMAARGDQLKYIVISPQCPREDNWRSDQQQSAVVKLLDHIQENYAVDPDRIYLTGLSMGGFGTWKLAASHGDRFAAVVPVCGGGDVADAPGLASIPIWVWHGDQDRSVPFDRSVEMVEAIRSAGGQQVRFTSLEHIGHFSWTAAYASPDLYSWLDQQTLSGRRE